MTKREVILKVLEVLRKEVESLEVSAQAAHEAATHAESKAEDQYDTRGLEASYLAGAQMARIQEINAAIGSLIGFADQAEDSSSATVIQLGTWVEVDSDGEPATYLLLPFAGGTRIDDGSGKKIQILTPKAPMGEAMIGKKAGDFFELDGPKGPREFEIIRLK